MPTLPLASRAARLRALFSLLLSLLACSCATPQFRPPGPEVAAPQLDGDHWQAPDGVRLPVRVWLPDGPPRAVVLALHGMNDYSNAFDEPGRAMAAKGIAVYAYDQRGFGQGPHPGYWSSAQAMAEDLREATALVAAHHPGVPLYLMGESMGGAVVMVAAAGTPPPQVKGLILSAPAVWGRASMGLFQRTALWLAYQVSPGWELTGQGLKIRPSDNIDMLRRLSRDPLVIKATRVDAIEGLVDLMDAATQAAPAIRLPTLVLYGAHDEIIPPDPMWQAIDTLPGLGRNQRVALYANGWHMLLRDLEAGVVVNDVTAWILNPAAPLPSGADTHAAEEMAKRKSDGDG